MSASEVPIACSLEAEAMPDRLAGWQGILRRATSRVATGDGALRIEFDDDVAADELTRLSVAEQRCCPFFAFTITVDARGVALEVRAPAAAADVVTALFGTPSIE